MKWTTMDLSNLEKLSEYIGYSPPTTWQYDEMPKENIQDYDPNIKIYPNRIQLPPSPWWCSRDGVWTRHHPTFENGLYSRGMNEIRFSKENPDGEHSDSKDSLED